MDKLFNADGKFVELMNRVGDFFLLNLCFIMACVPIVTVGPALIALYYISIKLYKREDINVVRSYFKSFKESMKSGLGIGIVMLFFMVIFLVDFFILFKTDAQISGLLVMGFVISFIAYLLMICYLFPLMARYENRLVNHCKNAFILSVKYFPKTILMIISVLVIVVSISLLVSLRPFLLIFGFATLAYLHVSLLMNIFKDLEKELN